MTPEIVFSDFPEMTEEDYQDIVARWLAIKDVDEADRVYESEVFPRSCYRMREQASEVPVELLFVPVGTQPYAPLMSCLGNPAEKTVLFMTEKSKECALQVEQALGRERAFQKVLISSDDPGDIVGKVMSVYDVAGQPKDVVCDVTGGTKIMTATLAGIAATNGWRQIYVDSVYIRNKGSHSERVIPVSSVFEHLGGWNSAHAWKLASVGQFGEAARLLKLAAEDSVASGQMKRDIRRFQLAQAYREANATKVCREVNSVAAKHGVTFASGTREIIASDDRRGFYYWLAQTLASEEHQLAACGALMSLGISAQPSELRTILGSLKKEHRKDWSLDAWKPVDGFLGRDFSREAAGRG